MKAYCQHKLDVRYGSITVASGNYIFYDDVHYNAA